MRFDFQWLLPLFLIFLLAVGAGCGGGGDDDDSGSDDAASDDDASDDSGDDTIDDDTGDDDDLTDDAADDDSMPDDFVASWPQSNIEIRDYDETPQAGDLRSKAEEYDLWHEGNHQPFFGSTLAAVFSDETLTQPIYYEMTGDSCIWTGTYLGGEALRYYVTGDEQARANVIKVAGALSEHLHVTGRSGFIARYRGPQDPLVYAGDENCDAGCCCHRIESGPYAGQWWESNTSRDQYTGWFFGMTMAYELVDDADLRDRIAQDVSEVLDELISTGWLITDVDGLPTSAGPNVLPIQQMTWLLMGYHMTGAERFKSELQKWLLDSRRTTIRLTTITLFDRYGGYYGNNLWHTNMYNLLRLGRVYLGPEDNGFLAGLFETQVHYYVRLSHNPWYNGIFMSQGAYDPQDAEYLDQLTGDLADFHDAPNSQYFLPDRTDYVVDPISQLLSDLVVNNPWLEPLIGDFDVQAKDAFPVPEQCFNDFLWQRSPFQIYACGREIVPGQPVEVFPGVDYIVAYWLANYHKFIGKSM